jgi:hypothetical protein
VLGLVIALDLVPFDHEQEHEHDYEGKMIQIFPSPVA